MIRPMKLVWPSTFSGSRSAHSLGMWRTASALMLILYSSKAPSKFPSRTGARFGSMSTSPLLGKKWWRSSRSFLDRAPQANCPLFLPREMIPSWNLDDSGHCMATTRLDLNLDGDYWTTIELDDFFPRTHSFWNFNGLANHWPCLLEFLRTSRLHRVASQIHHGKFAIL